MKVRIGMINGLVNRRKSVSPRRFNTVSLKSSVIFGVFITLLILVAASSSYLSAPSTFVESIRVDGFRGDWERIGDYESELTIQSSSRYLFFWVNTSAVTGSNGKMDAVRIWLDTDRDSNTGLYLNGLGADFRVVIESWNSTVRSASLCVWQGGPYWSYDSFGGCFAFKAAAGEGIEGAIRIWMLFLKGQRGFSYLSEVIRGNGERASFRFGESTPMEYPINPWSSGIRADGNIDDWNSATNITGHDVVARANATVSNDSYDVTGLDRIVSDTSTALLVRMNPSDFSASIPFVNRAPPNNEEPSNEVVPIQAHTRPDTRGWLIAVLGNVNVTSRIWQERSSETYRDNASAYSEVVSEIGIEITVPGYSWLGNISILAMSSSFHDSIGLPTIPPDESDWEDFGPLSAPNPPRLYDIAGNQKWWFRNPAHATETACTGTNDKEAWLTQGAGAVQTVSLTTGQNACWYLDKAAGETTSGITIPAGDWETLLDIQTTGDNGVSGNAVGVAAYRSDTNPGAACSGAATNFCPKISYWDGGGVWSTEYQLPSAGAAVENVRVEWSPLMTYEHWVAVNAGATITVYYCSDIGVCSSLGTATTQTVGTAPERHWDITVEKSSGDGILVYDNPSAVANNLCYRTFTTTLSGETCVDHSWVNTTNPSFEYVQLRSNPGVDTVGVFAADTTNDDAILWIWDGSAFLTGDDERACTLAYTLTKSYPGIVVAEDSSNEFTAFCGDGASNANICEWTSAAGWEYDNGATVTCTAFDPDASANNDVRTFSTGYAYEIGTNKDLVATNNDGNDIDVWAWLGVAGAGGANGLLQEPSSTDCSGVLRCYDTAFDPQDDDVNDGIIVLWDGVDARCEFRAWDRGTDTWSGTGTFDTCTGTTNWFTAIQSPWSTDATAAMILRGNSNNDVLAHQWTGGFTGTVDGEQTLSTQTTDQAYPYFDFSWGPRPVEYDVRIEIWNKATDTVSSTIGTCLNIITRGDDVQCLVSGVGAQTLGATEVVRVYVAHSSSAGTVIISYDDADSSGDSRITVPIPEFVEIIIPIVSVLLILAVWRRKR